jgi:hypothetical protein
MASHSIPANNPTRSTLNVGNISTSAPTEQYVGSLPNTFDQRYPTELNVTTDFPWTLSKVFNRKDIPFIRLIEHRNNESMIKRNIMFYAKGTLETIVGSAKGAIGYKNETDLLSVYNEIWPDNATGWVYNFPYFSKTQFELSTSQWSKVDGIGEAAKGVSDSAQGLLRNAGGGYAADIVGLVTGATEAIGSAAELALKGMSPLVGVVDRPRIFTQHNERSITISFPLYNTISPTDWKKNRDFYQIFASQNLFQKRDFVTGLPPVFYRVYIPGQYFSHASCVTNFTVENLGNTRLAYGDNGFIIPDAYQITITLTEMLMPSLNQFQAISNGQALGKVSTSSVATKLNERATRQAEASAPNTSSIPVLGAGLYGISYKTAPLTGPTVGSKK